MKVEEIIPEIHSLTNGIYYVELQRLVNYLMGIIPIDRKKYRVICRESVYNECKRITDFFNVKLYMAYDLPDKYLMVCVNYHELRKEWGLL